MLSKKKKMPIYITEDVEIYSGDENSDEEKGDKGNSDQENYSEE